MECGTREVLSLIDMACKTDLIFKRTSEEMDLKEVSRSNGRESRGIGSLRMPVIGICQEVVRINGYSMDECEFWVIDSENVMHGILRL